MRFDAIDPNIGYVDVLAGPDVPFAFFAQQITARICTVLGVDWWTLNGRIPPARQLTAGSPS